MSQQPVGKAFVDLVTSTVGQELNYGVFVGMLYEYCSRGNMLSLLGDLAFAAKSFQKLKRLMEAAGFDETSRVRISNEAQEALKKFLNLLSEAADNFPDGDRESFRREFLDMSQSSLERALGLLDDFSLVKDFFLSQRDREKGS